MERQYLETDETLIPFHQYQYSNDFGLIDFLNEANFDQFVDLIRGENVQSHQPVNVNVNTFETYDSNNNIVGVSDCDVGNFVPLPAPLELFDFDVDVAAGHGGDTSGDYSLQNGTGQKQQLDVDDEEDDMMEGDESSGTTNTNTTGTPTKEKKNKKVDRSRTLISERRRRSRMKDKLYALRSLVPNITKMDKASIVGDAVLYVQDLQNQAKKLRAEVSNLEQSFAGGKKNQGRLTTDQKKMNIDTNFYPITKKILKMDVFQVEERGFYVRIVSSKGKGVAMLLYKTLESLASFTVQSSNLAASAGNYVLTFTFHIMEQEIDINVSNLKLWITSIFLNQGFEFETSQSI